MTGPAPELAFLVLNPITVGLVAYRTGKLWPAGVCLALLLTYTLLAVPLVLNAAPPAYCHGQPDCPDPDNSRSTRVAASALRPPQPTQGRSPSRSGLRG
jgi:hypothetical protein